MKKGLITVGIKESHGATVDEYRFDVWFLKSKNSLKEIISISFKGTVLYDGTKKFNENVDFFFETIKQFSELNGVFAFYDEFYGTIEEKIENYLRDKAILGRRYDNMPAVMKLLAKCDKSYYGAIRELVKLDCINEDGELRGIFTEMFARKDVTDSANNAAHEYLQTAMRGCHLSTYDRLPGFVSRQLEQPIDTQTWNKNHEWMSETLKSIIIDICDEMIEVKGKVL